MAVAKEARASAKEPFRRVWRLWGTAGEMRIIRRVDARADDRFLVNPPGIGASLDRWIADPFTLNAAWEMFGAVTGQGLAGVVSLDDPDLALKPRLEQAFRTGELLVLWPSHSPSGSRRESGDEGKQDGKDAKSKGGDKPPPGQPPAKEKTWIEFEVVGPDGKPAAGVRYRLKITDGSVRTGTLDEAGRVRVRNIDPGTCDFTLLDYDGKSWRPA